jgi:hypothetical protein
MLTLADDAALARLVIAATAIPAVLVYRPRSAVEGMPVRPRMAPGRLISLGAPTKHRRRYFMPPLRRSPNSHRRRALELVASSREQGCSEALLVAHGVLGSDSEICAGWKS